MGQRKNSDSKKIIRIVIYIIAVVIIALLSQYTDIFASEDTGAKIKKEAKVVEGKLEMHTIDVGQGDSILLLQGDKVMLVDCGPRAQGKKVVEYLQNIGITKIDILVGTHPHEDHMGGMADVINNFDIGILYTSNLDDSNITTKYYLNFLDAVEKKNVKWENKKAKDEFSFGEADVTVLAPSKEKYENTNNYSLVLMVSYGETDIMLTGDAEKMLEDEILELNYDIECEILKAGHHGSNTSSSSNFVKAVNPKYAIISAGIANDYHHPHPSIMKQFNNSKITVYRTDEAGDIIMTTDGKNIDFDKEEGSYISGDELAEKQGVKNESN